MYNEAQVSPSNGYRIVYGVQTSEGERRGCFGEMHDGSLVDCVARAGLRWLELSLIIL